ncbi:MAG: hypothetical protein WKH64_03590 [Chloroflexia bacterium]
MSGEEGEEAELARALACEVEAALGVPVSLVDERLSSSRGGPTTARTGSTP